VEEDAEALVEVFGASGGAAAYRRTMLEDVGGFDERLEFGFEDVDLAWRARMRGWRTLHLSSAVVLHRHAGTVPLESPFRLYQGGLNRVRILAKHADAELLRRNWWRMLIYDTAYVGYAMVRLHSAAPLRGRLRGLRQWRRFRAAGREGRVAVELAPIQGIMAARRRRMGRR
jgi:GT2 family glycosyltransferase